MDLFLHFNLLGSVLMQFSKILCLVLASLIFPFVASAQILPPAQLNRIYYQFTEERWATTNTAKVTVNLDAALDKIGLNNINNYILANLNKIAEKAEWHIIEFARTKDNTELEKLHVVAEARLPDTALAELRDKAKAISKPGETYTIANIDFTPSNGELEKAHIDARVAIYEQVKQEVARLNAAYPDQKYFVNEIRFNPPQVAPVYTTLARAEVMPNSFQGAGAAQLGSAPAVKSATTSMSVNTKITEIASVTIASVAPEHPPQGQL